MNTQLKIILCLLFPFVSSAQPTLPDSLRIAFQKSSDDSIRYDAAIHLYDYYEEVNRDSAFFYADQCVQISSRNKRTINEAYVLTRRAYQELNRGQFAESLHSLLASFALIEPRVNDTSYWDVGTLRAEKEKRLFALSCTHHIYGILMRETLNREQEMIHFMEAKKIAVEINSPARSLLGSLNLGRIYLQNKGNLDSAMYYLHDAVSIAESTGWKKYLSSVLYYIGIVDFNKKDFIGGLQHLNQCVASAIKENNTDALTRAYHMLATYYISQKQGDSSVYFASKSLDAMRKLGAIVQIEYHLGGAYEGLYRAYQLNDQFDSAYRYLALAQSANDSINLRRIKSLAEFQKLTLDEQQRLQNTQKARVAYQNKVRTWFLLGGIAVLLLLAIVFYRNNLQKQKAKIKIQRAYDDLKATQQQLIHAEKMASLGELTAGIAHEIQNPLNFVNNFSEVNKDLLAEMTEEMERGNLGEAKQLAKNVIDNQDKINHHGKRAEAIVKGMLQHSRTSSGQKEPTDINALCDEYLRLAYHGFRAKDKNFNAKIETDFDAGIGKISLIPQDIGRVLVNLINNAFYAASLPSKGGISEQASHKTPIISVSTRKDGNTLLISLRDNGPGIPSNILDKIFQPFFTTKPTGQGTGLGLSLAYDIVKAHGGELKVETEEGEGSEFIIQLPVV